MRSLASDVRQLAIRLSGRRRRAPKASGKTTSYEAIAPQALDASGRARKQPAQPAGVLEEIQRENRVIYRAGDLTARSQASESKRSRMRTQLWTAWLFLTAVTWSAPVWAAPDAERLKAAADEFDAGRRAYRLRDFENAAVHFENADRDVPSPEALQSAIRARKEAGQGARAATLAAWALSRYPGDAELAESAPKLLADADKALFKVNVSCAPGCTLVVDDKVAPFGETPAATLYLEPGSHSVVASWPNDRNTRAAIEATAGGTNSVSFSAPAAPAVSSTAADPSAPPPPDADRAQQSGLPPAVFFAGVGATVIMTGVTTWSGIDTINNPGKDAIASQCQPRDTNCEAYQLGLSHQRRTNMLIGATAVVAAATAVVGLFFTNWGGSKASEAFVAPTLTMDNGIGLGAVGRF